MELSAPWHRASYDRFLNEALPRLLAARLPLTGYKFAETSPSTCRIEIRLRGPEQEIAIAFDALPQPDTTGRFWRGGSPYVVLPLASRDALEEAEIACAGEQMLLHIAARLGEAPEELPWDEALARNWAPLDLWMRTFLEKTAQRLDQTNLLSQLSHLRRISLPDSGRLMTPGQRGRACPIETPENPNIGKVLAVAMGATIRDGRLEIVDTRPEMSLGLSASLIPFLEHSEPVRLTMGANMMRQWVAPHHPDPALVRTGNEPAAAEFWAGHNLLTAYVPWGIDSFEDAIILSDSCARRLSSPLPVQPGDKLSNRHGAKGVVSRILPDAEMPHLPGGDAVDLVYDCMGLYSRLNFGQTREALLGRIAQAEGGAALAPSFGAPSEEALRHRLRAAGLPEDGMEQLSDVLTGEPLERRSLVGVVYWGRLLHTAAKGYGASVGPEGCQRQGELEVYALRAAGAAETVREQFHLRASESPDAARLADLVREGAPLSTSQPGPRCAALLRRLALAGIRTAFEEDGIAFRFELPTGELLTLAAPIPHPWLPERLLKEVGLSSFRAAEADAVSEANTRLSRLMATGAPGALRAAAFAELERAVRRWLDVLVPASLMRLQTRPIFSGRAVATPGMLRPDQAGLPEEMAWTLFSPMLERTMDRVEVEGRTPAAAALLDRLMADSWVLIQRPPVIEPTGFMAFHPVRCAGTVIRLHPLANHGLNADFDGDLLFVFLPLTEDGQREAGEKLSLVGHLRRDPGLLGGFLPLHGARAGLALLARTPEGREQTGRAAGIETGAMEPSLNRGGLLALAQQILEARGPEATIAALDRLAWLGFARVKRSGLSMSPFLGSAFARLDPPRTEDPEQWAVYTEALIAQLDSERDGGDLEPYLLAVRSGARSNYAILQKFVGAYGVVEDREGKRAVIKSALKDGVTPDEFHILSACGRQGIARAAAELENVSRTLRRGNTPTGYGVLARAMRARHPGLVFARAAAMRDTDPLTDPESRLYAG